jgi:hypothetical protein
MQTQKVANFNYTVNDSEHETKKHETTNKCSTEDYTIVWDLKQCDLVMNTISKGQEVGLQCISKSSVKFLESCGN